MLPQETVVKQDVLVEVLRKMQYDAAPDDREVRDSEALRQQMTALIPELGALIRRHARQLGERLEQDCPFQTDTLSEWLLWQTVEYLTQADHDKDNRIGNVKAYQLTAAHAAYWADWPPTPETVEVQ
jgi:hypothetical protein